MRNHLVFRYYPITCHFRKIKTLGSTESAGIVGGELFGSVTVNFDKRRDVNIILVQSMTDVIKTKLKIR